ncbi:MAG: 50S ribosomal protein L23 [Patescibacteria group bacterium]
MSILKRKKLEVVDASKDASKKEAPQKKAKAADEAPKKTKRDVKATSHAYRVLLKPLVTEKAAHHASGGVYTFRVANDVGKVEVREAVKALYGVVPRRVNMVSVHGKRVRFGRTMGQRGAWQKAYVFLKKGEHLDVYEGV